MKNKILNPIALTAFFLLLTSFLCCSGKGDATTATGKASEGKGSIKTGEAVVNESAERPSYMIGKISSDTLILTVGSSPVYWPEFLFWLKYIQKYYRSYHNIDRITDWSVEQNGMDLKNFFLSTAVGYACKDRAIEAKAEEIGIELSCHDLEEINKQRQDNIKIYGSELEYIRIVSSMYVTEDVFKYLTKIDYLGNYMFEHIYGKKGEKCNDKAVSAYVKEQGLMCAKYIFLSKTDPAGNDVGTEKRAENLLLLKDILGRLDSSDNPPALFDEMMIQYGEDRAMLNYPDGRLFVSDAMGQEFESAYLKLGENKYSDIVQADKGLYIILRTPIFPDMTVDSSGNTLRYHTAYDHLFKNQVEEWSSEIKVKYEDAYYTIDVEGIQDY